MDMHKAVSAIIFDNEVKVAFRESDKSLTTTSSVELRFEPHVAGASDGSSTSSSSLLVAECLGFIANSSPIDAKEASAIKGINDINPKVSKLEETYLKVTVLLCSNATSDRYMRTHISCNLL